MVSIGLVIEYMEDNPWNWTIVSFVMMRKRAVFYPRSHVGINIVGYGHHQNVLIEGIRGTGKTHILKMVERFYFENFEDLRILPIFVSLAQINEHARKEPDEFRLHLYTYIVKTSIETVEKYSDDIQPDVNLFRSAIQTLGKLFGISGKPQLNEIINILRRTTNELLYNLQFDLTSETLRSTDVDRLAIGSRTGSAMNTKTKILNASIESEITGQLESSHELEGRMMFMGSRLAHRNATNFILEFLSQIQILLNLDYLLILLDEISEADPAAQVEVFRLFKTIRGASSKMGGKETCAFFIGSVYPRGETYYPSRMSDGFSFDPGNDCTMDFLQWDETDIDSYISFFRDMTLNRAKEIQGFNGNWEELLTNLFEDEKTFLLAAFCSHGIPRRYWEMLKRGYDRISGKILFSFLENGINQIVNDQILAHPSITDEGTNFVYHLVTTLASHNVNIRRKNRTRQGRNPIPQNIYFSVNRRYRELLRHLVMQGVIHDKSRMRTISKPKRPQPMFVMDMAIVYTYRIIPPKSFLQVITRDIPKAL